MAHVIHRLRPGHDRSTVTPRISGHGAGSWHLHVSEDDGPVASVVAEALFGMTMVVTSLGADRFGICSAAACNDVFVDTSPNRSRRFCSDRCATRTNVAAYRLRRSLAPAS